MIALAGQLVHGRASRRPTVGRAGFRADLGSQMGWDMDFDLVIFDCDGVLIDSEMISAQMLIAELAEHGIEVDLAYVARHFLGRSYPVVLSQIRAEFGIALPEQFEADYRARLLASFQCDLSVMPGVTEVIDALDRPFALATSSSPPRLEMSLRIAGLSERFSGRAYTSALVTHGKPAPDLFLHTARQMGADPARCLVIEDSLNGVLAGLAAGMHVCRFIGGSHLGPGTPEEPADARPHARIANFADFFKTYPSLQKA